MAEITEAGRRRPLSGWPMIIFWAAMILCALHACLRMVGAGDTWVAMACGRHFINHGVDTVEPFSANSHKAGPTEKEIDAWPEPWRTVAQKFDIETVRYWHPTGWVNQNWLTHVVFYWLTHLSPFADAETFDKPIEEQHFTYNTLVYWKYALYIITVIVVYYTGRVLGVNPALSAVFACFALFVGRTFFDIRPAGFSNLFVAVLLFIFILTTYKNILYIWLIVPVIVLWCNLHGGYVYAFVVLIPFIGLHFLCSFSKKWFVSIGIKGVCHTIAASATAFVAMIIFNPFHLTNLTHTFIVSVSEDAKLWKSVNEWHPAFEWKNPVGVEQPFLIMYILAWLVLAVWVVTLFLRPKPVGKQARRNKSEIKGDYEWPRIDIALIFIAALTVYMAIGSRRFIPIAAIAACPIMALFINQSYCMVSAVINYKKNGKLSLTVVPEILRKTVIRYAFVTITIIVIFLGLWWGYWYKTIYLNPWPDSPDLSSVFMRMSASYAKPFTTCEFIRDNKLSGKVFNYWTEGGFIAYGQIPDPNTGKTPLQLFMDGRAQAAYNTKAYKRWMYIMSGGAPASSAMRAGRKAMTNSDYTAIGKWLDATFKKEDVWVVLMPIAQFNSTLVKGLEKHPDWRPVFMNNGQKMFADITSGQGKALYGGMFTGGTKFPDEYSRLLTTSYTLLRTKDEQKLRQGLARLIKAMEINPSQMIVIELFGAARRHREFGPTVAAFLKKYFEDFETNKDKYAAKDGYRNRLIAAMLAGNYLDSVNSKDSEAADRYKNKVKKYSEEQKNLQKTSRW